jgi:ABC-type glycerol-3-phosphate transport system permease component
MGSWNSFLWPQITLQHQERFTLPIVMNQMISLYQQEDNTPIAGAFLPRRLSAGELP